MATPLPLEEDIPFKVKYTWNKPPKNKPRSRKRKAIRRRQQSISNGSGVVTSSPGTPTTPGFTPGDRRSVGMMTEDHLNGLNSLLVNGNGISHSNGVKEFQPAGRAVVKPNREWMNLRRYKNFVRKDETFSINDYVFIENPHAEPSHLSSDTSDGESDPEDPNNTHPNSSRRTRNPRTPPSTPRPRRWIARVDEICASETGPDRVFLRVSWLYRPEDLPGGRQYYHGKRELVMSNHIDIVDALSVSGRADVRHWRELDDEDDGLEYYWRQEVDVLGGGLSDIRSHCTCCRPYNPDRLMVRCENCHLWLHEECVVSDTLRRYNATSKAARRASGRNASISTAFALTSLSSPTSPITPTSTTQKRKSIGFPMSSTTYEEGCGNEEDEMLQQLRREMRPRLVVEKKMINGSGGSGLKGMSRRVNGHRVKRECDEDEEGGNGVFNGFGSGGASQQRTGRPRVQMRRKVWGSGGEGGQLIWEDVECLRCRRRVE